MELERLNNILESRLRAARLWLSEEDYTPLMDDYLAVLVDVLTIDSEDTYDGFTSYSTSFGYNRYVRNVNYGEGGSVGLWNLGHIGHANRRDDAKSAIVETLSEYADEFVSKYLRINEQACE